MALAEDVFVAVRAFFRASRGHAISTDDPYALPCAGGARLAGEGGERERAHTKLPVCLTRGAIVRYAHDDNDARLVTEYPLLRLNAPGDFRAEGSPARGRRINLHDCIGAGGGDDRPALVPRPVR